MKTKKIFLSLLAALTTLFFSCESEETDIQENTIESTNISDLIISAEKFNFDIESNERFRYNLDLADGEEASIVSEAKNASISWINGKGIYIHTSEEDFIGTDSVLVRIEEEPQEEGLILSVGNVRYVYLALNVGESYESLIESAYRHEMSVSTGIETNIPFGWGDEEEPEIIIEPENGQLGDFTIFPEFGFSYKSDEGFTGTDHVLIKVTDHFLPDENGEYPIRYVYYTINVEESSEGIAVDDDTLINIIDEDTLINITTGACGTLAFQEKLGTDHYTAIASLKEFRSAYLVSRCPDNPCFDTYSIVNLEIGTDFSLDNRQFIGINYMYYKDGNASSAFGLIDVVDTKGNYYTIDQCLD